MKKINCNKYLNTDEAKALVSWSDVMERKISVEEIETENGQRFRVYASQKQSGLQILV